VSEIDISPVCHPKRLQQRARAASIHYSIDHYLESLARQRSLRGAGLLSEGGLIVVGGEECPPTPDVLCIAPFIDQILATMAAICSAVWAGSRPTANAGRAPGCPYGSSD